MFQHAQLVENHSQRPHVALVVVPLSAGHFRCHEEWRPHNRHVHLLVQTHVGANLGDAKVRQLQTIVRVDQHVSRLQVPVDNLALVQILQRFRHVTILGHHDALGKEGALLLATVQKLRQISPLGKLRDHIPRIARLKEAKVPEDPRVVDLRQNRVLLRDGLVRVFRAVVRNRLDHNPAVAFVLTVAVQADASGKKTKENLCKEWQPGTILLSKRLPAVTSGTQTRFELQLAQVNVEELEGHFVNFKSTQTQ